MSATMERDLLVLGMRAEGVPYNEIAAHLCVSEKRAKQIVDDARTRHDRRRMLNTPASFYYRERWGDDGKLPCNLTRCGRRTML